MRDNIRLLVIGDQTIIARALETQIVDAAVLTTRTYIPGLKQKGFSVLNEVTPAMAATGIVTRKTYLQKNPEILENIMKAMIEARTLHDVVRWQSAIDQNNHVPPEAHGHRGGGGGARRCH